MVTLKFSDLLDDSNLILKDDTGSYYSLKYDSEIRSGFDDRIITIILKKGGKLTKKSVVELD